MLAVIVTLVLLSCFLTCGLGLIRIGLATSKSHVVPVNRLLPLSGAPTQRNIDECVGTLRTSTITKNVDRIKIIEAIQVVSKATKVAPPPSIDNSKWELIFCSQPGGSELGFLFGGFLNGYFLAEEYLSFSNNERATISLTSFWGGFQGQYRTVNKKPLSIEYEFLEFNPLNVPLLGKLQEFPKDNTKGYEFIFFDEKEEMAIARILPSGAAVLMKRVN